MHRYPRVGHAGTTYMACNKIDRSIHTKKCIAIMKQSAIQPFILNIPIS